MNFEVSGAMSFLCVDDLSIARAFYAGTLGMTVLGETPDSLVLAFWDGVPLRITAIEGFQPQPFTVLGWTVPDINAGIATLADAGVQPLIYDGMPQDERGVMTIGNGIHLFWFKDPAGNVLSLTQA